MSKITKIEFWKDSGFQEGSVEVPSLADTLPYPDYTLSDGIFTSTSDFYSSFTVSGDYLDYLNYSYLRITYEFNDDSKQVMYAWIESVALKSDTKREVDEHIIRDASVRIDYNIDYWRTYLHSMSVWDGIVTRRPRSDNDPPQNCSYRYRKLSAKADDLCQSSMYWAIMTITEEDSSHKNTYIREVTCPIASNGSNVYYKLGSDGTTHKAPTLYDWCLGKYDEIFSISPSAISSAFISPLAPVNIKSGTGTSDDPLVIGGTYVPTPTPVTTPITGGFLPYINDGDGGVPELTAVVDEAGNTKTYSIYDWGDGDDLYQSFDYTEANTYTVRVHSGSTEILSNSTPLTVMSVRDWVKRAIGDAAYSNLQSGDTVKFTNHIIYMAGSVDITQSTTVDGNWFYTDIDLGTYWSVPTHEYTVTVQSNNLLPANLWIIADELSANINAEITTTATAFTSDDYGEELSTVSGYTDTGYIYLKRLRCYQHNLSLPTERWTSDTEELVVLDQTGQPIGTVPWGLHIQSYTARCIITSTSGYVQFRFDSLNSASEGLEFSIPMQPIDITSNSWSDYVISGQRDYDISQRKIASQQALVSGILGATTSSVDTAVMGGIGGMSKNAIARLARQVNTDTMSAAQINGSEDYRKGYLAANTASSASLQSRLANTGVGVRGGFGARLGVGVASSIAEYAIAQHFNGELQKAEDMLQAKQIDAIISPGGGVDFIYYGQSVTLSSLVPDEYSLTRFANDIKLNGVTCSEPTEDCTALIQATGPIQITGATITGNCPVQAKQYVRGRLENGVRIITYNTGGVILE